jgi:hypothetical protein
MKTKRPWHLAKEFRGSHMRIFPKTTLLLSVVTATLAIAWMAVEAQQPKQPEVPAKEIELKLSVEVKYLETSDSLRFRVTFENTGDKDTVLNLGMMLGNGTALLPDAVGLVLTDSMGQTRELQFADKKHPGVAGRLDDYAVPLRAGSSYTLTLGLNDFWCPKTKEFSFKLEPGKYSVRAEFANDKAQQEKGLLMHLWTGHVESEVAQFQIGGKG